MIALVCVCVCVCVCVEIEHMCTSRSALAKHSLIISSLSKLCLSLLMSSKLTANSSNESSLSLSLSSFSSEPSCFEASSTSVAISKSSS